jgi:hypothetical protein
MAAVRLAELQAEHDGQPGRQASTLLLLSHKAIPPSACNHRGTPPGDGGWVGGPGTGQLFDHKRDPRSFIRDIDALDTWHDGGSAHRPGSHRGSRTDRSARSATRHGSVPSAVQDWAVPSPLERSGVWVDEPAHEATMIRGGMSAS